MQVDLKANDVQALPTKTGLVLNISVGFTKVEASMTELDARALIAKLQTALLQRPGANK